MARVLVTGAGGFLGRHVRAALTGHEIISLGRSEPGGPDSIRLDLATCSPSDLATELAGYAPEAVINCAGATQGEMRAMQAANVEAVATLLEAAAGNPLIRLVQLGSAAEYGRERPGADEGRSLHPVSDYGVTKLAATRLVLDATAARKIDGVVLRLFNPVGAGMSEATLLGRAAAVIRQALAREEREIRFGPLSAVRDFIDARDAADAIVGAAFVERPAARLLDCGSGQPTLAREVVHTLARIAGFDGAIVEEGDGSSRSPGVSGWAADSQRIERILGWRPRHALADAIGALWDDVSQRRVA